MKVFARGAKKARRCGHTMYNDGHSVFSPTPNRALVEEGLDLLHYANKLDLAVQLAEATAVGGTIIGLWDLGNCLYDNY